jgi:hypothetical protein
MKNYTLDFSLDVHGVNGFCPAGEVYSKQQIAKKSIPVLSCEGHSGRNRRLAANLVAQEVPSLARCVPCGNILCSSFLNGSLGS